MIAFVRKRHGLSFRAACEALGCWQRSGFNDPELGRRRLEREREQTERAAKIEIERRQRIQVRDCLHILERSYREESQRLAQLQAGATEQFMGEMESCWELLSLELDCIRDLESRYFGLSGLGVAE